MQENLIIVGVDPGTTVGYVIFDLKGNLLKIHSKKTNRDSYIEKSCGLKNAEEKNEIFIRTGKRG